MLVEGAEQEVRRAAAGDVHGDRQLVEPEGSAGRILHRPQDRAEREDPEDREELETR